MARFVAPTLFSDPRASGSFELIDDPWEVATREAVEELIEHVIEAQTVIPQFDVVFVSDPDSRELENEALYQFNRSARFFVHNRRELATVLDVDEATLNKIWPGGQLDPSPEILGEMVTEWKNDGLFRSSHLLLVRIRQIDEHKGDFFCVAEGRIFEANKDLRIETSPVVNQYGVCIDRRDMLVPILALHGILLLVSLVLYPVLVKVTSHSGKFPSWQNTLAFGGLGFCWGRGLIWILAPAMAGIEPAAETLAIWSFWWPAVAGTVFILGPAVILGFAERRFKWFGSAFETFNRGGALYASIGLGSAAFLGQCALIYKGPGVWWLLPPLVLATVLAAFTVGRASDKTDTMPLVAGGLAGLMTLGLGATWCMASAELLWLTPVAFAAVLLVFSRRKPDHTAPEMPPASTNMDAPNSVPADSQALAEWAYNPPFHESSSFLKVDAALNPWRKGKTAIIGLTGPAGVGKSAALNALEAKARENIADLIVLRGDCDQPLSENSSRPYEPFAQAIANHFSVNLLAPSGDQMGQIDEALGGIFDRVVPFADLLFPPRKHGRTGSSQELFTAIAAMLKRLATRHSVLLVFDDVHWMDPASLELLEFLLAEFPESADCPIAIVLASRCERDFVDKFDQSSVVNIESLDTDELRQVLIGGLGTDSVLIDDVVGVAGQHRDNLHWLFQIVAHLAQQGLLVRGEEGFTWKDPGTRISEHVPSDIRKSLETLIANNKEFRAVLECAACVGQEFPVELISSGIGLSRLELIHLLDHIEEQTGIVTDLRDKDDHFAFRSSFVLEVLRKSRDVLADGPRVAAIPQRVREYHYRLATVLEESLDQSNTALYEVANHYYAAGGRHAEKAIGFSIKAARTACFQFQHDLAHKFVAMAEDCVAFADGRAFDFEREHLLIDCHQAHVEGKNRVDVSTQAIAFLQKHPDADFEIFRNVALACYDAGIDTRDQKHFADCVRIAGEMQERFSAPLEQAEAFHFLAIGLPTDQAETRIKHLRTAMNLAEQVGQDNERDLDALRLKSRIAGSLAQQLSQGGHSQRLEASELFHASIQIKQREDIRDVEGLASAYGGLGRLAFFQAPPDFETARKNFEEDLRYSEMIGSVTGITKMHSMLGACAMGLDKSDAGFETALGHYEVAHSAAVERVDQIFALAGLLECNASLSRMDAVDNYGNELCRLIDNSVSRLSEEQRFADPVSAIPQMCISSIDAALKKTGQQAGSQWHQWLTVLLGENRCS